MKFARLFTFFLLTPLFVLSLQAEEAVLLNGQKAAYVSIFSMNEEGITFETNNGLVFHSWKDFGEDEAERLSGGKYHEYRELQNKKREWKEKQSKITASQGLKELHPVVQLKEKEKKPDFYNQKTPGPARNLIPGEDYAKDFASRDLDRLINFSGSIWTWSMAHFLDHQKDMSYFIRDRMNEGVEVTRSYSPKLTFLGMKVWESMAIFKNGHLQELSFLLFSRGDDDNISEKNFTHLVIEAQNKITEWVKKEPVSLRDADMNKNIKEENKVWTKAVYQFQLRWSFTQSGGFFIPEYVRLRILPFDPKNPAQNKLFTQESSLHNELTLYDLGARVRKTANGDVFIEGVPMVDQGKKGYCAVASAERVLRYYGREIDQHQLAQLAGTSSYYGTSRKEMMTAIYKIGRSENVKIDVHYDMSVQKFIKMLYRYNKQAYRRKSSGILDDTVHTVEEFFQRLDKNLIQELRLKEHGNFEKFKATLIRQASSGIPLLWTVIVGIFPEKPAIPGKGGGGHMRLIIGFNLQTSEILYTDSWGKGHELKRMSFEKAWAITTGLYTLQPKHWNYSNTGHLDFQLGLNQKSLLTTQKQK